MSTWSPEPYFQWWVSLVPDPAPEPSPWEVQKAANRLARMTEKAEQSRFLPKLPYRLNGLSKRKLHEAVSRAPRG